MFYYLLNHSSLLNKQNEKAKNLSIILFGSLVYLAIHAFLSFNKNTSIQKIKPYFWFMFLLDTIMSYYSFIYKSKQYKNNDNELQHNKKEQITCVKRKNSIQYKLLKIKKEEASSSHRFLVLLSK